MSSRAQHHRWSFLIVCSLLIAMVGPIVSAQEATPEATPLGNAGDQPAILFVGDSMRPDLVARYSEEGITPTLAQLAANGTVGENGLLQSFPPDTGTGWTTIDTGTWPGGHGVVSNTFYRTGDADFGNSSSAYEPGISQAQTIAEAAEQYGQSVVVLQAWPGSSDLDPEINGPYIEYWTEYTYSTVLTNEDLGPDAGFHQQVTLNEATGWTNVPESSSPALEQQLVVDTNEPDRNPARSYNLYIYDSTDDGAVNYDRVLVDTADAPATGATPVAEPVASPIAGNKDGSDAVADLAVGDWQDVKVTLTGEEAGLTAGFHLKLIDLSADASAFRIYATAIARYTATFNGCDYAPDCAEPTGFADTVNKDFPSATGSDYYQLEYGLIDEDTFVEQGRMAVDATRAQLDFILNELAVEPDLLMLGSPLIDEFSHEFLGLVTETGPGGTSNPRYDDRNNDGQPDGLVEARNGYLETAYADTDALLADAMGHLDQANVVVASAQGFAPQWFAVNGSLILQEAGLSPDGETENCEIPEGADPATVQAKICTSGGTAHIYVNLVDRDLPGAVAEEDYDAVRQQIVDAFTALKDPGNPDAEVVAGVYLREEINDAFGIGTVHPSRTGDIVVVLNPPYQFEDPTPGEVIAPSLFSGQDGFLPDLVDLDANINMHGAFLAGGPAIKAGATITGVRAIDVAPTVAFLLGIPGPANASGNILYDALADGEGLSELTIVSFSDYHAQFAPLSAPADSFTDENAPGISAPVGGAAYLYPWFNYFRDGARDGQLLLTASDIIGATPPLSAFFDDMPAIEMMNAFGLDAAAIGNHHFDINYQWFIDLMPMAQYPSLGANIVLGSDATPVAIREPGATPYADTGGPWSPTTMFEINGMTVGVIGITTLDTLRVTREGALGPYQLLEPVPVVNEYAAQLRAQGADIVVVLAHEGATAGTLSEPTGPIVDIADASVGVDTILGDHTSQQVLSLRDNGVLLTQNVAKGYSITRTRIVTDRETGTVVYKTADWHLPWNTSVEPDPVISARIAELSADIEPILGEQVGVAQGPVLRSDNCGGDTGRLCESVIGNIVTDAMRYTYDADFAINNSGGIRADLTCPVEDSPDDFCAADLPPYAITRGQVLGVLPFGNVAVTVDLNGVELKALLEAGLVDSPAEFGGFQQISGLCLTYSVDRDPGDRITSAVRQADDGTCTGEAIDFSESATYTIISNDFSMSGGDGYPNFSERMVTLGILDEVVAAYLAGGTDALAAGTPISTGIQGRITCEGSTCPVPLTNP